MNEYLNAQLSPCPDGVEAAFFTEKVLDGGQTVCYVMDRVFDRACPVFISTDGSGAGLPDHCRYDDYKSAPGSAMAWLDGQWLPLPLLTAFTPGRHILRVLVSTGKGGAAHRSEGGF